MGRGRGRVLVFAALALFVFGGAADGAAGKKKKKAKPPAPGPVLTVSQTKDAPADQSVSAVAACPPGTALTGGGHRVSADSPFVAPLVYASRASGNEWRVEAVRSVFVGPSTLTAEAYCRKGAQPLTESSRTETAPASEDLAGAKVEATARCPSGQTAVAGGFAGSGTSLEGVSTYTSARGADGTSWTVVANSTLSVQATISAIVYCSKQPVTEISGAATTATQVVPFSATAGGCPVVTVKTKRRKKGKKGGKRMGSAAKKKRKKRSRKVQTQIVSGGFRSNATLTPGMLPTVFPREAFRTATGWEVTGIHLGPETDPLVALGYCSL
jgi:hypothetical protein